jgi:hypothetical protein
VLLSLSVGLEVLGNKPLCLATSAVRCCLRRSTGPGLVTVLSLCTRLGFKVGLTRGLSGSSVLSRVVASCNNCDEREET